MLEHDYPVFKMQIRKLAAKRATRFGMNPTRVTLEVPEVTADRPRRISVDIDPVTGLPLTAGLADEGAVHLDSIDKPVAIFAELEALTALREELTRRTVHLAAMVAAQTAAGPGAADGGAAGVAECGGGWGAAGTLESARGRGLLGWLSDLGVERGLTGVAGRMAEAGYTDVLLMVEGRTPLDGSSPGRTPVEPVRRRTARPPPRRLHSAPPPARLLLETPLAIPRAAVGSEMVAGRCRWTRPG